jgi:hypothetical protein
MVQRCVVPLLPPGRPRGAHRGPLSVGRWDGPRAPWRPKHPGAPLAPQTPASWPHRPAAGHLGRPALCLSAPRHPGAPPRRPVTPSRAEHPLPRARAGPPAPRRSPMPPSLFHSPLQKRKARGVPRGATHRRATDRPGVAARGCIAQQGRSRHANTPRWSAKALPARCACDFRDPTPCTGVLGLLQSGLPGSVVARTCGSARRRAPGRAPGSRRTRPPGAAARRGGPAPPTMAPCALPGPPPAAEPARWPGPSSLAHGVAAAGPAAAAWLGAACSGRSRRRRRPRRLVACARGECEGERGGVGGGLSAWLLRGAAGRTRDGAADARGPCTGQHHGRAEQGGAGGTERCGVSQLACGRPP